MSILIKGMELPKDEPMLVKINPDGSVSTTAKNGYKKYEAVPVPLHGDLIGRNPLIDIAMHLRNRAKDEYAKKVIGSVIRYIAEAPAVIPSEEA